MGTLDVSPRDVNPPVKPTQVGGTLGVDILPRVHTAFLRFASPHRLVGDGQNPCVPHGVPVPVPGRVVTIGT